MTTYEIECGSVRGAVKAESPGSGFRKLIRQSKAPQFGELARFRRLDHPRGPWMYQEPEALRKSP